MTSIPKISAYYIDPGPIEYYPPAKAPTDQEIFGVIFSPGMLIFLIVATLLLIGIDKLETFSHFIR